MKERKGSLMMDYTRGKNIIQKYKNQGVREVVARFVDQAKEPETKT